MWKLKDKPRTLRVTKALATEYANMDPAPRDRPLSERRLQVYQRIFSQGSFRPVTWAKAECVETGGTYRVNGKHTSILLSGLPSPLPEFYVTIETYQCETLDDVARLYATFDSRTQSRTTSDINLSFAGTVPNLAELPAKSINVAVSGMSYHIHGESWGSIPPPERAELLLEHCDFVLWFHSIMTPPEYEEEHRNSRHMQRQAVAAAMMGTWQKSQSDSTKFWMAVRNETGDKPTLPDRKLARYLLTVSVNKGPGSKKIKVGTGREMYVKCIHAWNAWRRGETSNLQYYADADVPAIK